MSEDEDHGPIERTFGFNQQVQMNLSESSTTVHERLRDRAVMSFVVVETGMRIKTPSWYTFDLSSILGIANAVLVSTSTCKHEFPAQIFVGTRSKGFRRETGGKYEYLLNPLGADITMEQKNQIYDLMP